MKKRIKSGGDKVGVAFQVQGQIVDAIPDSKYPNTWHFLYKGEKWIASDYTFDENYKED